MVDEQGIVWTDPTLRFVVDQIEFLFEPEVGVDYPERAFVQMKDDDKYARPGHSAYLDRDPAKLIFAWLAKFYGFKTVDEKVVTKTVVTIR